MSTEEVLTRQRDLERAILAMMRYYEAQPEQAGCAGRCSAEGELLRGRLRAAEAAYWYAVLADVSARLLPN